MDNSLRHTERLSFFDYIGYVQLQNDKENVELKIETVPNLLSDDGTVPTGIFTTMLDIVIGATISNVCDSFCNNY